MIVDRRVMKTACKVAITLSLLLFSIEVTASDEANIPARLSKVETEIQILSGKMDLILKQLNIAHQTLSSTSNQSVIRMVPGAEFEAYLINGRRDYQNVRTGEIVDNMIDVSATWDPRNIFTRNAKYGDIYGSKTIAGYWTGFLHASESGRYVFSYKAKGQGWNKGGCHIAFYISDKPVFLKTYGVYGADYIAHVELEQGPNNAMLWFATTGHGNGLSPTILYKAPSSEKFETLTPGVLLHRE